jgi:hypothetical protein
VAVANAIESGFGCAFARRAPSNHFSKSGIGSSGRVAGRKPLLSIVAPSRQVEARIMPERDARIACGSLACGPPPGPVKESIEASRIRHEIA